MAGILKFKGYKKSSDWKVGILSSFRLQYGLNQKISEMKLSP
jgi:hypothetical protein